MDKLLDVLLSLYGPMPYLLLFGVLLVCGLGLPIPEDITLFAAGAIAYYGVTKLWVTILICYAGVLIGDAIMFGLGATYGRRLTRFWLFQKLLPEDRLNSVKKQFHQRGNRLIFWARFMPGLRAPIYFSAGTLHLPVRIFLFYDGLAALLSVPAIIGAVYYFGDELDHVIRVIRGVEHSIIILIAAVIVAIVTKWYITHRRLKREQVR